MPDYVFISYSKKNRDYAQMLARELLARRFDVWIDDRLDYGQSWEREIFRAIEGCTAFIVLMTPESYDSDWVLRECQYADKRRKPQFPLLLAGEEFPRYGPTQFADVREGRPPKEDFFTRLAAVVPRDQLGEDVTPAKFATDEMPAAHETPTLIHTPAAPQPPVQVPSYPPAQPAPAVQFAPYMPPVPRPSQRTISPIVVIVGIGAILALGVGALAAFIVPNMMNAATAPTEALIQSAPSYEIAEPTGYPTDAPPLEVACAGVLPTRLRSGTTARVIPGGTPNRLRSDPSALSDDNLIGRIEPGETLMLTGASICDMEGGLRWWPVAYEGLTGYTAEATGDTYYLEPYAPTDNEPTPAG